MLKFFVPLFLPSKSFEPMINAAIEDNKQVVEAVVNDTNKLKDLRIFSEGTPEPPFLTLTKMLEKKSDSELEYFRFRGKLSQSLSSFMLF